MAVPLPEAGAERIGWIDAARGIGIVLVVFGHALGGLIDSPIGSGLGWARPAFLAIYTFHMPLFFVLAGAMVPHRLGRGPGAFVRGLGAAIVVPYFAWSALQLSVIHALGGLVNNPVAAFWPNLMALPWRTVSQFWFLYALFWMHCLAALIIPRAGAGMLLGAALALRAGVVAMTAGAPAGGEIAVPAIVRLIAAHAPFYALGALLGAGGLARLAAARPMGRQVAGVGVAAAGFFASLPLAGLAGGDIALATASSPELASLAWRWPALPAAVAGVIGVIVLAGIPAVCASPLLNRMGRMTMPIFLLHVMFVAGCRIVLLRSGVVTDAVLLAPLLTVAGLAGPLVAARMLRLLPWRRWIGF